jgi:hypothetical protein
VIDEFHAILRQQRTGWPAGYLETERKGRPHMTDRPIV